MCTGGPDRPYTVGPQGKSRGAVRLRSVDRTIASSAAASTMRSRCRRSATASRRRRSCRRARRRRRAECVAPQSCASRANARVAQCAMTSALRQPVRAAPAWRPNAFADASWHRERPLHIFTAELRGCGPMRGRREVALARRARCGRLAQTRIGSIAKFMLRRMTSHRSRDRFRRLVHRDVVAAVPLSWG